MSTLEKKEIKEAIREIMQEDKVFFKTLLREIIEEPAQEAKSAETEPVPGRAERIDATIYRDFERYKNVFKALA